MALVIGGHRHAEWVDVLDGQAFWVDITNATTHRIRKLGWGITRIGKNGPELTGENYKLALAVHPDLTDPSMEQAVVTELIKMLAMNEFIRAHGESQQQEQDVPDSPAALFGPDGQPL